MPLTDSGSPTREEATNTKVSPFEVWLVRFTFLDKPSVTKIRPAIALETSAPGQALAMVKVTSHAPRPAVLGELVLSDWKQAGLLKPSCVRCSQQARIPLDFLLRPIGRLTPRDAHRLAAALRELGAIE